MLSSSDGRLCSTTSYRMPLSHQYNRPCKVRNGGGRCTGLLGVALTVQIRQQMAGLITPSCMSVGGMQLHIASGHRCACRLRRNGSTRRAADWIARDTPGATSWSRTVATCATSGREYSPTTTRSQMGSMARHLSASINRTGLGFAMSQEMCGNGAQTGGRRVSTAMSDGQRGSTPRVRDAAMRR